MVVVRGGGDLASGVALRLHRAGLPILITELPQPLSVRRLVSFSEAVYAGAWRVEGVTARLAADAREASQVLARGEIAVLVDPAANVRLALPPKVLIDARMTKCPPDPSTHSTGSGQASLRAGPSTGLRAGLGGYAAPLVIGLGPGFIPGDGPRRNCHAAVETMRGHYLGRVYWDQPPAPDTGLPETVGPRGAERVLRAPVAGIFEAAAPIGAHLQEGEIAAWVRTAGLPETHHPIRAAFGGVLRGLLRSGVAVFPGMKVGDLDPRGDPAYCVTVSDKALAVGGGVLEAIISHQNSSKER